ncbi:MAG: carboxypeptidase regulatory-like domain-containing protein [candidate division Zixibacteria bacterium]|nr:carboxypeptidase regulatory-like domain-containing protein [candidate division Zixibacteria bacterium]
MNDPKHTGPDRKPGSPLDPDFEVQEQLDKDPDHGSFKRSEGIGAEQSKLELPGSTGKRRPDMPDPDTLSIQRPIEALFDSKQPDNIKGVGEEIQLPEKRWSKKEFKKMKKKWREQERESGSKQVDNRPIITPPAFKPAPSPNQGTTAPGPVLPKTTPLHLELKQTEPAKSTPTPSAGVKSVPSSTGPVSVSRGIAYVDTQNRIKIAGGHKVYPGDQVTVGGQDYIVKTAKKSMTPFYIGGGAVGLFLVFIMVLLFSGGSGNSGNISGIVVEYGSRALIPGAKIRIVETGAMVSSNDLGFFNFQDLPQGTYTLEASFPGYSSVSDFTTVAHDKTSNLALLFNTAASRNRSQMPTPGETPGRSNVAPNKNLSAPVTSSGSLSVRNIPGDAIVLVDNEQVGRGSGIYRGIKSGDHTVRISKQGYNDWVGTVSVPSGQTKNLTIKLEKQSGLDNGLTTGTFDDYLKAGKTAYDAKNYMAAVNNYNMAAKMKSSPEVFLGRGLALVKTGKNTDASNDFIKAADIYAERHNFSQAAQAYSYYLELNPSSGKIYYERGKAYLQSGNYSQAAKDIKRYVDDNPKALGGHLDLGRAYFLAGDYDKSIDSYHQARKLNAMDKRPYIGLTKSYVYKNDKKGAKEYYDKYRELATYMDREKMKDDSEWGKILAFLGVKE